MLGIKIARLIEIVYNLDTIKKCLKQQLGFYEQIYKGVAHGKYHTPDILEANDSDRRWHES